MLVEDSASGTVTVVAGNLNNGSGYSGDGGQAVNAQLSSPVNVAVDASGNLYFSDYGNNVVRKVAGGVITTVAGGPFGYVGDNGLATSALLFYPAYTAADLHGDVYMADTEHHLVRKVTNGAITTVAGNGTPGYTGDNGAATSATLSAPWGLAVDGAGNLYIADYGSNVVRKVSGGVITTVAGNWDCQF